MMALREISQDGPPTEEMTRLHGAGFSLLPLGRGDDGKSPLLSFTAKQRLPLSRVLAPMHRINASCYGVRLDGLAVIDCDTNDPEVVNAMEARFGASPVHVRTPRGMHLYYRASGNHFPNLRGEGYQVDVKRGSTSYVMGPGSIRPDGGEYVPAKGTLGRDELPEIILENTAPRTSRDRIAEGGRNYALTVAAIKMVESVDDPDELLGNLQFLRDDECHDPATVPDHELQKITDWAWSRRLEGKVYMGRNSEFRLHRQALDALKGLPNASDAIALFVTLQDLHGHVPARTFPLDHAAMMKTGHTDLSRRRFLEARRSLEDAGLLQIANTHRASHYRRSYRLKRVIPSIANNVTQLRPTTGGGV